MKKKEVSYKMKKQRKRVVTHSFRKRSTSSNTSLSQLLSFASHKNKVKALARNNRCLAIELQCSRLENAHLDSQLKDLNKNNYQNGHQIMHARLKLKAMADTISQLVTDMAEVTNYLDGCSIPDVLEKVPHEKLKIKSPTVDCIEEVSVIASEIESSSREEQTESIEIPSPVSTVTTPEQQFSSDLPPILFVEDSEEKNEQKSSSSGGKNSNKSNIGYQGSLTPELDIDFSVFKKRRTSSRRQTQQFDFPEMRKTRSGVKTTSSGRSNVSDQLVTPVKASLPAMLSEHSCDKLMEVEDNLEQISSEKIIATTTNLCHDSQNTDNLNALTNACVTSLHFSLNDKAHIPQNFPQVDVNHSVQDMELTCTVPVLRENNADSNSHKVDSEEKSNINKSILVNNDSQPLKTTGPCDSIVEYSSITPPLQQSLNDSPNPNKSILFGDSFPPFPVLVSHQKPITSPKQIENISSIENVPVLHDSVSFSDVVTHHQKHQSSIFQNENNIPKSNEIDVDVLLSPHSVKLKRQTKRSKKPIEYNGFFSSDESDQDSSPSKQLNGHKSKKRSVFKSKSSDKVSSIATDDICLAKIASEDEDIAKRNDISVYDLDVSNSKMKKCQKSKLNKRKKASQKEDSPKQQFQNFSVTKLKNGVFKFHKNEGPGKAKKTNQLLESKPNLELNPIETIANIEMPDISQCGNEKGIINLRKSILSKNKYTDNIEETLVSGVNAGCQGAQKLEPRRVSFAATDIVCSFKKNSISKNILENKKLKRISKCANEIGDIYVLSNEKVDATVESVSHKVDLNNIFDSSNETELYTLPSCGRIEIDHLQQLTTSVNSSVAYQSDNIQSDNIDDIISKTSNITHKRKEKTSSKDLTLDSSNETELYTLPSCGQVEIDHLQQFTTSVNSSVAYQSDNTQSDNIDDIISKTSNITHKRKEKTSIKEDLTLTDSQLSVKRLGKLSLKQNRISQRELSDEIGKENGVPQKEVINSQSLQAKDILLYDFSNESRKNLIHFDPQTSDILKDETPIKTKVYEDPVTESHAKDCRGSSVVDSKVKSKTSASKKVQRKSKRTPKLSPKQNMLSRSSKKVDCFPRVSNKSALESSPVLKDVINLEGNEEGNILPKRRSKVVNYKEASLNKKLRRN